MNKKSSVLLILTAGLFLLIVLLVQFQESTTRAEIKSLIAKVEAFEKNGKVARDRLRAPLEVEVHDLDYEIKDQMFDPILKGKVTILASHQALPHYAYLQLLVSVDLQETDYAQISDTVWVNLVGGRGESHFQFSLPTHRLDNAKASIHFTPLSWHRGFPVSFISSEFEQKPVASVRGTR